MSTDWECTLDPGVAIKHRTELSLNSGPIQIRGGEGGGIDWGESQIKAFLAEQLYGEAPTDFRIPNRIITIPLALGAEPTGSIEEQEEARKKLQKKVALLQREGGVLKRSRSVPAGEEEEEIITYADIVNASLIIPDIWGQGAGIEPNVVLKLECLPDFYGPEKQLQSFEAEGDCEHILQEEGQSGEEKASIEGDYPGRVRIVVTDESGVNQRSVLWGWRSRDYREGGTNRLLAYSANELGTVNEAEQISETDTYDGKAIRVKEPPLNSWLPFLEMKKKIVRLRHIGMYRVWARVKGHSGQSIRLSWSKEGASTPIRNEAVELGPNASDQRGQGSPRGWMMVDLGEVNLERSPIGNEGIWGGFFEVNTGEISSNFYVDRIFLQPIEEGAGRLIGPAEATGEVAEQEEPGETYESSSALIKGSKAWEVRTPRAQAEIELHGSGEAVKSDALYISNFQFNVPSGASIKGVRVIVEERQAGIGRSTSQLNAYLVKGGTTLSEQGIPRGRVGNLGLFFGGKTEKWGLALTAADVNSESFGVALQAESLGSTVFSVFNIRAIVYYTLAGTSTPEDAVIYANQTCEIRWDGSWRSAPEDSSDYMRVSQEVGDLPRIPVSGLEDRPVQLFLKVIEGLIDPDEMSISPGAKDKFKVQVLYSPCYIGRN